MAKYYNADTLLEFVKQNTPHIDGLTTMLCVERAILETPTADVVEVVRCKDCEFRGTEDCSNSYYLECEGAYVDPMEDDDFCSYGERKDT